MTARHASAAASNDARALRTPPHVLRSRVRVLAVAGEEGRAA